MSVNEKFGVPPWRDRRALAAELSGQGYSIKAVAEQLGLSPATARRYLKLFGSGGTGALLRLGDVGRRRKLSSESLNWLVAAIKHSPAIHGFPEPHWTSNTVGELIERKFQIRYSRSHINALIHEPGLRGSVR